MIFISRGQGINTESNPGNSIERIEYEAPVTMVLEDLKRQTGNGASRRSATAAKLLHTTGLGEQGRRPGLTGGSQSNPGETQLPLKTLHRVGETGGTPGFFHWLVLAGSRLSRQMTGEEPLQPEQITEELEEVLCINRQITITTIEPIFTL